jgi:tRNA-uridine 2-sulfurtransferase
MERDRTQQPRGYPDRMADDRFADHLARPRGRGVTPAGAHTGAAGGAACGDLVRVSVAVDGDRVRAAGFDASGCGAVIAAGSAVVAGIEGKPLLDALRISAGTISAELGGLSPAKRHAADLTSDALHRALGSAARAGAALAGDPRRTLIAMSGGVDSAVAALLTTRAGGDAVAVTLELWADPDNDAERSCCSAAAVRTARELAHGMGLPHITLDLRREFRAGVVEPWLADHAAGLTPNPCVRCNGHVRLDAMVELADRLGAGALATGHYARLEDGLLRVAADPAKDQSYMLAAVPPDTLARLRFPLGELRKDEVRALAGEAGLPVAGKPDSQDLCFLAGTGKAAFLAKHGRIEDRAGGILDIEGRRVGDHAGHHRFTVGQRRGIGIGAREPLYVLRTDANENTVTVGTREQLRATRVAIRDVTLLRPGAHVDRVKLRYRSRSLPCRVADDAAPGEHAALELELAEPALGAAPGQAACLMAGDLIVGHGTIAASRHAVPA